MKQEVLISIIIPVYNVEQYIEECLNSILNQSFENYEIICIDDASTDTSCEIIQKYAQKNAHIRLLKNIKNKGQSHARNRGIKEAVGEYIMFVDSDDILQKDSMEKINELLHKYAEIEILYYDAEVRDEGKWAKEQPKMRLEQNLKETGNVCTGQELFVQLQRESFLIDQVWRQIIKRDFLEEKKITFYEGIYHEDGIFSLYCALDANKVVYVAEPFYIYRRRDNSTMSTMNIKRVQSYFIFFIELWNRWKNGIWSEDIDKLFEEYLYNIYKMYISKLNYYPNRELRDLGNQADKFLYKLIADTQMKTYEYVRFSEAQIREIEKNSNIIIYGAGNVGIEVVQLLKSRKIEIKGILVSDKRSNPEGILGIPIYEYGEYIIGEKDLIIIAISKDNKKAVVDVIEKTKMYNQAKIMLYDGTIIR